MVVVLTIDFVKSELRIRPGAAMGALLPRKKNPHMLPHEQTCCVYLIGYPHAQYGHAVKVGIAGDVPKRLAQIQCHNPEPIEVHFTFSFPTRELAREIECRFHRRFRHERIRGEWFSMGHRRSLFMLCVEVIRVLAARYEGGRLRVMQAGCGLNDAIASLDDYPDKDEIEEGLWIGELHNLDDAMGIQA
ncbi:GIY-YIG nuclease family protein [Mesorhizobium sp. Cs1299R1N3]|uniref:GIY-YIG nuclease family protein n=1 Tax=Mesorhizobium sp. Cs1299R1N3 TaxID=3015173 RepID=UPI00301CF9B2